MEKKFFFIFILFSIFFYIQQGRQGQRSVKTLHFFFPIALFFHNRKMQKISTIVSIAMVVNTFSVYIEKKTIANRYSQAQTLFRNSHYFYHLRYLRDKTLQSPFSIIVFIFLLTYNNLKYLKKYCTHLTIF